MLNTLVWGFPYEFAPIIDEFKARNILDIRVWIGTEKQCTYSRKNFMEKDLSFPFHSPVRCPDHLYDRVYQEVFSFLQMIDRRNVHKKYYTHTLFDYLDYFNQQLNYFYYLLSSNKIEFVLIDKIAHYGEDWLLYAIARAMNLKTLLLFPSHFPERFFYVSRIEDFGYFHDIPDQPDLDTDILNPQAQMQAYIKYLKTFKPYEYTFLNALSDFTRQHQTMAFHKWQRFRQYRKQLNALIDPRPDLEKPFVYFPLHLQPELSTFPLGDKYVDQALAIETLAEILPDDW